MAGAGAESAQAAELWRAQAYLARIILHDLGSPLSAVLLYADVLLGQDPEPGTRQRLERIRDAALRSQALTDRLAAIIAPASGAGGAVTLEGLLETAQAILATRLAARGVQLDVQTLAAAPALAAEQPAALVLLTTLLAAAAGLEAAGEQGGVVTINAERVTGTVRVYLTGPGVSEPPGGPMGLFGSEAAASVLGGRLWVEARESGLRTLVLEVPAAE